MIVIRQDDVYKIGKLGKAHGVKGEISMQVDDDIFDRLEEDAFDLAGSSPLHGKDRDNRQQSNTSPAPSQGGENYQLSDTTPSQGGENRDNRQQSTTSPHTLVDSSPLLGRGRGRFLVLLLDGIMVPFFMEEYRFKTDETALIKFEGIDNQERARELTGTEVYFPRQLAEADDSNDMTYAQLVGYTVIDGRTGKAAGVIDFVDEQTINIMFELQDGTLIPASEELIIEIDTERKEITMDIPEGILSL